MHQAVGGECLAAIEFESPAIKAADSASRLFDDQRSGGCVPRVEIKFPEAVEAPARNIAEVESCRSSAPHAMGVKRDLVIEEDVRVLVPLVAGETGGYQALVQLADLRYVKRLAVEFGAFALLRGEEFIACRIVNHTRNPDLLILGTMLNRHRNGEHGESVGKVSGPIERIHIPAIFAAAVFQSLLFAEHIVAGKLPGDSLANQGL